MIHFLKLGSRPRKAPQAVLGLSWEGRRIEGTLLRRTPGGFQKAADFQAELSVDIDSGDPETLGQELRAQLDQAGIRERTMLEISNLVAGYGGVPILRGVSLSVGAGEIVAVLGANGVNPGQFITKFNDATRELNGRVVGCIVTVYSDRTFDLEIKSSPASELIKAELKLEKGSGEPNTKKVGKITQAQLRKIAEGKMKDMNAATVEAAMRVIAGSARSMGVTVEN